MCTAAGNRGVADLPTFCSVPCFCLMPKIPGPGVCVDSRNAVNLIPLFPALSGGGHRAVSWRPRMVSRFSPPIRTISHPLYDACTELGIDTKSPGLSALLQLLLPLILIRM